MTKTILCYGDSNTWGFIPCEENHQSTPKKRYPRNIRWPGRLQQLLGDHYHVIEEGLNSRTTNLDYHIPPDRNGATYLAPCLYSHAPIDLVILALGGNDLKTYFHRTINDVCNGMRMLIDMIQLSNYGPEMQSAPKILILSQIIPLPMVEQLKDEQGNTVFKDLIHNAELLRDAYKKLAAEKNCYFLDITENVTPSEIDGIHLDEKGHAISAEWIAKKTKEIL